ncbi:hypothetical protein PSHT_15406 [Puccinia striiformis]|uniref:SUN domain-containing protein n=1 Tax=Puccinia striiformis TaxID=27350 RepID=A0A2S4UF81_9BASI|nr:hypothetical protein PSHT_15406 [Puccinia striiformis]
MSACQSTRPRSLSQVAPSQPSNHRGTFGKQAAIRWKFMKQNGGAILVIAVTLLLLKSVTQEQSLLNKKLHVLENHLQEISEAANDLMNNAMYKSQLNERLSQMQYHWKVGPAAQHLTHNCLEQKEEREHIGFTRKDFASFLGGASIIGPLMSPTWAHHRKIWSSVLPFHNKLEKISGSPPVIVLPSDLSIGSCWPFHGTTRQLGIHLSRTIWVKGITIGHVFE